jgi:cell fate regulator YaaT (PSP1 superfamily)
VVRTQRGVEWGEVLSTAARAGQPDGPLLRRMTGADELLASRLQRSKQEALLACEQLLRERQIPATLLDAELTFDGRSLYFYFLGESSPQLEHLTSELAAAYDAQAQLRKFADTMLTGCGPDCGTKEGGGSDGGCSTCAISQGCGHS